MSPGREPSYSSYLNVPQLLSGVRPLSSEESGPATHAAEHYFIVAHQAAELWLKQILLDLDRTADELGERPCAIERAVAHVERAVHALGMVNDATAALQRLPPAEFVRFRCDLGTASGAQSTQFHELARRLGPAASEESLLRPFLAMLHDSGVTLPALYRQGPAAGPAYALAEALSEVALGFWRWQVDHISTVWRTLGEARGTARSSGVGHLVSRCRLPFPELWAARSGVHGHPAATG